MFYLVPRGFTGFCLVFCPRGAEYFFLSLYKNTERISMKFAEVINATNRLNDYFWAKLKHE